MKASETPAEATPALLTTTSSRALRLRQQLLDSAVYAGVARHVEFEDLDRFGAQRLGDGAVAPLDIANAGKDLMPGGGERFGGIAAEAAGSA